MRVLIAEDDAQTANFIKRGLSELGHSAVVTGNGLDAMHLLSTQPLDVAILDRMLPGLDGLSVLRRARTEGVVVPILILTALGRIDDRVSGFEAGADDYLVKPFAFSELAARVNALTRRRLTNAQPTTLQHGDLLVDPVKRQVSRSGEAVILQPREFRLLEECNVHG